MVEVDVERLIELHPRLFHMANAGSWQSIRRNGLLTTEQIVTSSGLSGDQASALLQERRPYSVPIDHPTLGRVSIRDQGPLRVQFLEPKLEDVTVSEWLRILNDRVFFWLHPDKLEQLLNARRYRNLEQDVLTVDTRALVDAYQDRIRLSPINSGASLYPNAAVRGSSTFAPIHDYDYDARRRQRSTTNAIVELAVVGGVPDISRFVVKAERRLGSQTLEELPVESYIQQ